MKKVNFFIIGAPKCGTTSLYEYLHTHPRICFSESKEPNYFSSDFPGYQNSHSLDEYIDKEFHHCQTTNQVLGESSVWYLYSSVAISEIHRYNPDAKIIIMLRNPVDMLYSLHSQLVYNLDEDVSDFERAWDLQELRVEGNHIPRYCRVPEFLQYKKIGMYSTQIQRAYEHFPKQQVKIILFNDFTKDTEGSYRDVLDFLGLEYDNRTDFHVANANKTILFRPLAVLIHRPPKFVFDSIRALKRILGIHRFGIHPILDKINILLNSRKDTRPPLNMDFKMKILDELADDIDATSKLIGKDLSDWKNI